MYNFHTYDTKLHIFHINLELLVIWNYYALILQPIGIKVHYQKYESSCVRNYWSKFHNPETMCNRKEKIQGWLVVPEK